MLTEHIIHDCLIRLFRANSEESFEVLSHLLKIVGKIIDNEKAEVIRIQTKQKQVMKNSLFLLYIGNIISFENMAFLY